MLFIPLPLPLLNAQNIKQLVIKQAFKWAILVTMLVRGMKTNATWGCLVCDTDSIYQTNTYDNRSLSSLDTRNFYCQPPSIASYHGSAVSAITLRCQKSGNSRWFVAEEDSVNHGGTISRNGKACRCRCCTSQMTEVCGRPLLQRGLLEYPNDAWASQVLVSSACAACSMVLG